MAKPMKVKQIPFPEELLKHAEIRRKGMGIGFPEYIRHLVLNDIENIYDAPVTKEEREQVIQSLKEYAEGKYYVIRNKEDMRKYLGFDPKK